MPDTASPLMSDIWFDKTKVEDEEYKYQVYLAKQRTVKPAQKRVTVVEPSTGVASQIAEAREKIHQTLHDTTSSSGGDVAGKLKDLEDENAELKKLVKNLADRMSKLEIRLGKLEGSNVTAAAPESKEVTQEEENDDSDDDVDLFGSDSEDEAKFAELVKKKAEEAEAVKKAKPKVIAKSTIVLDVKPWDDQTDMQEVERCVRSIKCDGLLWGKSKLVEVAFGIMKLQIGCVVEDDKVGTDFLEEEVTKWEDLVQSVDIVAFNKV